jgi:hypothetical protein
MSGIKGGEVLVQIRQNKEIIDQEDGKISKDLRNRQEKIEKKNEDIQKTRNTIKEKNLNIGVSQEVFSGEANKLRSEYEKIKSDALSYNDNETPDALKRIDAESKKITSALQKLLDDGEKLRQTVTSHYQDANYAKAKDIQSKIRSKLKEKFALLNRAQELYERVQNQHSNLNKALKELERIQAAAKELDEKALVKKTVDGYKSATKQSFNSVDEERARKFEAQAYQKIESELKKYLSSDEETILSQYEQLMLKIAELKKKVEQKYIVWYEKKSSAEAILSNLESEVERYSVEDPTKGNSEISLFDFDKKFLKKGFSEMYQRAMSRYHILFNNEDFDQCSGILNELSTDFLNLKRECSEKSITLKKNVAITKDTLSALEKLEYDIRVETIAHNPVNGFTIKCTVGDEILFLEPGFNDDGHIKFDINHIMSDGRDADNCKIGMKQLFDALQNEGIPITDIKKDGKSVINGKRHMIPGIHEVTTDR